MRRFHVVGVRDNGFRETLASFMTEDAAVLASRLGFTGIMVVEADDPPCETASQWA